MAGAATHDILDPVGRAELVVILLPVHPIPVRATLEEVVPRPSGKEVRPAEAIDDVVTDVAEEAVITGPPAS